MHETGNDSVFGAAGGFKTALSLPLLTLNSFTDPSKQPIFEI